MRVAPADPHQPERRPRPPRPAHARSPAAGGGDYYLANKFAAAEGEQALEQEQVVQRLSQDGIVNALAEVPHDFRDVVVLVDIGEFSHAEAAQILDIPIGTVMSRLHRGRRILKHKLAEETVP